MADRAPLKCGRPHAPGSGAGSGPRTHSGQSQGSHCGSSRPPPPGNPINPPHGNKAARARIRLSRGGDLGADPPDQRRKDFLLLLVEQRVFCSHLTYQELFLGQRLHLLVLSVLSVSRQTFKEALPEHEEGGNPCVVSSKGHLPLGSA